MLFIGPISSIFDYVTYFVRSMASRTNPALFQTGWFVEFLLTQTLIIHIIRTARIPFLESRASTALITTTIVIAAIGDSLDIFLARPLSWFVAAFGLLVPAQPYPLELRHPDAFREDMVYSMLRVELNG